jgi:hypothetical protein
MRKDGGFSVKVGDKRYVWNPVDVSVSVGDGAKMCAGWACEDVPGLHVNYDDRAPVDRFDPNLSKECMCTHVQSGLSLFASIGRLEAARRAVSAHLYTSVDWLSSQRDVVNMSDEDKEAIKRMRDGVFKPPVDMPVFLEGHGDLWQYSADLVKRLRGLAKAEAFSIAGRLYTAQNPRALTVAARYIDSLKASNPLVIASLTDGNVNMHVVHATGSACFHVCVCEDGGE